MVEVSQRAEFECAYLSSVEDSNKLMLNAHQYKIEVTVLNSANGNTEPVIEFAELKKVIRRVLPDKYFLIDSTRKNLDERAIEAALVNLGVPIRHCTYPICAENICDDLAHRIQVILSDEYKGIFIEEVKLRETSSSIVTWRRVIQ